MFRRSDFSESDWSLLIEINVRVLQLTGGADEENLPRRLEVAADLADAATIRALLRTPNSCLA